MTNFLFWKKNCWGAPIVTFVVKAFILCVLTHFLRFTIYIHLGLNIWIGRCVYKSVRNLLTESSWQDRSFFSSLFRSSAKDRGRFLPFWLPLCASVPDFVTVFSVKFICVFSSTCLKGIFHITTFYVWLNVHTKGRERVSRGLQGLYRQYRLFAQMVKDKKTAQETQTQGDQTAQWRPARSLHLHNQIGEKAWTIARRCSGQSIGNIPRLSRCKQLNLSFRLIQF